MEFKDFVEKRERMCKHCPVCHDCPLYSSNLPDRKPYTTCEKWCLKHPKLAEKIVDNWTKDHPIITNAAKFKEVFGLDIKYSSHNPGYLYIDNLVQITSSDRIGDVIKWLESEHIAPEEKQND